MNGLWDKNPVWHWRAGDITSPKFDSYAKMKRHFFQNRPNSTDRVAVIVGDKVQRIYAFYDAEFNTRKASNEEIHELFYGLPC